MSRFSAATILLAALPIAAAHAQEQRLVTWNVGGAERTPAEVETSVENLVSRIGPIDVLVLQEVIAEEQVEAAARALDHPHWVISDFSPPPNITGSPFRSLEVPVISRTPITGAAEWDLTGRGEHGDNFAPRPSSDQILTEELDIDVPLGSSRPSRGFLRVDLEVGPSVYAVHWKSSLGESCNAADIDFARQREDQASGLIVDARRLLAEGRSVVVAGDYNIQAPGRVLRVGTSATEDCAPQGSCEGACGPGGLDGYDDSIDALLELDDARLLSASLPETFIRQSFPGGAIDHILVAGSLADRFQDASTPDVSGTSFEGSDHRPVIAVFSTTSEETPGEKIRRLLDEIESRIVEIEGLLQDQ